MGCRCLCHDWLRGTQRAALDDEQYMTAFGYAQRSRHWRELMEDADGVDVRDPIEAALACKLCIARHCAALAGPPPPLRPRPAREQADGWTDPPEPTGTQ